MKKIGLILMILVALLVAIGAVSAFTLMTLLKPVSSTPADSIRFVIPKGQAISVIANRLAEQKLIKHPLAFRVVLKQQGLEGKLQAGSFELSPSMTPVEIARKLVQGTDDVWVTIPEGWRVEEVAESLDRQDLELFDKEAFLELADASEGKLFPDTYLVSKDTTAEMMYSLLTSTFEQKVVKGLAAKIEASEHDVDEVITMASLIEREASGTDEMPEVAGVLWKRLEIGMPLQVDATLQYVKGYDKTQQSWWVPPLAADKTITSPFNTYLNPGLPPRPISSPGLDAIKAALEPVTTDNLFYIHDRKGAVHFAKTLEEHNANVQKYLR